jgi:hypothetical protein
MVFLVTLEQLHAQRLKMMEMFYCAAIHGVMDSVPAYDERAELNALWDACETLEDSGFVPNEQFQDKTLEQIRAYVGECMEMDLRRYDEMIVEAMEGYQVVYPSKLDDGSAIIKLSNGFGRAA